MKRVTVEAHKAKLLASFTTRVRTQLRKRHAPPHLADEAAGYIAKAHAAGYTAVITALSLIDGAHRRGPS